MLQSHTTWALTLALVVDFFGRDDFVDDHLQEVALAGHPE